MWQHLLDANYLRQHKRRLYALKRQFLLFIGYPRRWKKILCVTKEEADEKKLKIMKIEKNRKVEIKEEVESERISEIQKESKI